MATKVRTRTYIAAIIGMAVVPFGRLAIKALPPDTQDGVWMFFNVIATVVATSMLALVVCAFWRDARKKRHKETPPQL
jgi:hypothetical protein